MDMERREINLQKEDIDAVVGGAGLDTFGGRKITEADTVLCSFRCWNCGHEDVLTETGTSFLGYVKNRLTSSFAARACPNCQSSDFLFEQVADVQY